MAADESRDDEEDRPDADSSGGGDADKATGEGGSDGGGDDEEDEEPSAPMNPIVKWGLVIAALLLVIGAVAYGYNYWTRGRYHQSTNDAYIRADLVTVSPKLAGYVEQVLVQDNQWVSPGQPLVRLDDSDTLAQLEQAQAQAAEGRASIVQARAQIRQQQAQIASAEAQLGGSRSQAFYAQRQVDRYLPLAASGAQTVEELDRMRQMRDQQNATVRQNGAELLSQRRQIATYEAQIATARAQIAAAEAQVRRYEKDLESTIVRSSIRGRIGSRTVRVGQYVQTGGRMMTVVPVEGVYLEANFKETQVGLMRVGQPAAITVDAFVGGELHGTVESFSPGTGSEFAVLPPQNATGNFTKIVQRVPVRIRVDSGPEARKILVPGLSVEVSVDTYGAKAEREAAVRESERGAKENERRSEQAIERDKKGAQSGPGR